MNTRTGIGLANSADGEQCGREVARAALDSLRADGAAPVPALGLLFISHPQTERVLRGVREALGDVPLIGATSAGEYTHRGYVEDGAGLMLVASSSIRFHPLSRTGWGRWLGRSRLLGKLQGISTGGLGGTHHYRSLVIFPDDQSMNLDHVVEQAMSETALLYDILGGPGPTIPAPPRTPAVLVNGRLYRAGLVGAELLSQQPLGLSLANGWTPVSGPYRVTRTDSRRLVTLDGRPAREVYEDFLAEHNHVSGDPIPHDVLLRHPIGLCSAGRQTGDCKVSLVMDIDAAGALEMTAPPPESSLVHILTMRPQAMLTAATRAVRAAQQKLNGASSSGLLFIDCMSTAMVLGEAHQQQQAAVRNALGEVPFLGFRSHGVLARLHGQVSGLYECSVGTLMLPE